MIICGDLTLPERFRSNELLAFGSRILKHRLELAGTQVELFAQPALEALFQATNGLPRKINLLAHLSLNIAALQQAQEVSAEHIQKAVEETG